MINIKMTKEQKNKLRKVFDERLRQISYINSYITVVKSIEVFENLSIDKYKLIKTTDNTLEFITKLEDELVLLNIICDKAIDNKEELNEVFKDNLKYTINIMSIVEDILSKHIMVDNKVNIENIYEVDIVKEVDTFYELNKDDYEYKGLSDIYKEYKQYTYIRTLELLLIYISDLLELEKEKED